MHVIDDADTATDNGRKRHIVVDTLGLLIAVLVTAANVPDRDGARRVLDRAKMAMPSLVCVWADGGYAGKLVAWVARYCRIMVEIVRKPKGQRTFEVLPRRWVVERTLSGVVAARRDYERLPETSEALVKWAMIGLMARRLAPPPGRRPWQPRHREPEPVGVPGVVREEPARSVKRHQRRPSPPRRACRPPCAVRCARPGLWPAARTTRTSKTAETPVSAVAAVRASCPVASGPEASARIVRPSPMLLACLGQNSRRHADNLTRITDTNRRKQTA